MLVEQQGHQLEEINLSDTFDILYKLAYDTGEEIFEMYRVPLDVIVSERYMAFLVIMDNTIVFKYRVGDIL